MERYKKFLKFGDRTSKGNEKKKKKIKCIKKVRGSCSCYVRAATAHLGYDSMIRRSRDTIFWLGINREIREVADNCLACQKRLPSNPKEPLLHHTEGNHP